VQQREREEAPEPAGEVLLMHSGRRMAAGQGTVPAKPEVSPA